MDKILKIKSCSLCPIAEEIEGHLCCTLNHHINIENHYTKIHEDCPLNDVQSELKEKDERIKELEARLKIEIAGKQSAIEVLQEFIAENKLLNTTEDNT